MPINMLNIGLAVAKELGAGFRALPHERFEDVVILWNQGADRDFGIKMKLTSDVPEKIRIYGNWPVATDGAEFPQQNEQTSSIYVSATRPPKQIAGEIQRRFLSDYLTTFSKAVTTRNEHDLYLTQRLEMATHFAKLIKGKVLPSQDRIDGGPSASGGRGYLRDFYVNASQNTVNIHLASISADLAEKILTMWLEGWYGNCRSCFRELNEERLCQDPECYYHTHYQTEE